MTDGDCWVDPDRPMWIADFGNVDDFPVVTCLVDCTDFADMGKPEACVGVGVFDKTVGKPLWVGAVPGLIVLCQEPRHCVIVLFPKVVSSGMQAMTAPPVVCVRNAENLG